MVSMVTMMEMDLLMYSITNYQYLGTEIKQFRLFEVSMATTTTGGRDL